MFGNIQTGFTPGKYHVVRHNWSDVSIQSDSGCTLCTLNIEGEVDEDGENQDEVMEWQDAQMTFFAASREMYEALVLADKALESLSQLEGFTTPCHQGIKQALAIARGESINQPTTAQP